MVRYTIEELLQLKPSETLTANFDAVEFRAIIEKVKHLQALKEEEFGFHGHFSRRRSSHHHGKPKIKHTKPKVTTDSDGWSTFEANKKGSGDEEELEKPVRETAPQPIAQETLKVKPNNKNIASSKPADAKDIIADKPIQSFNAFAALESEEEDDE
ncbi:CAF20 (YOR276W) [Zygosaccharomyces parabailii]|nr:CAF20 (YOR276W) [Zygosaccharomyces parabailii]CDH10067.1 probable Cap-associated protein CAF20 [Zygosaccharomyces bailii ISA1307]